MNESLGGPISPTKLRAKRDAMVRLLGGYTEAVPEGEDIKKILDGYERRVAAYELYDALFEHVQREESANTGQSDDLTQGIGAAATNTNISVG